jgi:hypothetical protein
LIEYREETSVIITKIMIKQDIGAMKRINFKRKRYNH